MTMLEEEQDVLSRQDCGEMKRSFNDIGHIGTCIQSNKIALGRENKIKLNLSTSSGQLVDEDGAKPKTPEVG